MLINNIWFWEEEYCMLFAVDIDFRRRFCFGMIVGEKFANWFILLKRRNKRKPIEKEALVVNSGKNNFCVAKVLAQSLRSSQTSRNLRTFSLSNSVVFNALSSNDSYKLIVSQH